MQPLVCLLLSACCCLHGAAADPSPRAPLLMRPEAPACTSRWPVGWDRLMRAAAARVAHYPPVVARGPMALALRLVHNDFIYCVRLLLSGGRCRCP
jgi:hypothetical protein